MSDIIEITDADKSRAVSLFMALRRYWPDDAERCEWIMATMQRSFAKARLASTPAPAASPTPQEDRCLASTCQCRDHQGDAERDRIMGYPPVLCAACGLRSCPGDCEQGQGCTICASRTASPTGTVCRYEARIGSVLHVCNRRAGHPPPHMLELFDRTEPKEPTTPTYPATLGASPTGDAPAFCNKCGWIGVGSANGMGVAHFDKTGCNYLAIIASPPTGDARPCQHPPPYFTAFPPGTKYAGRKQCIECGLLLPPAPPAETKEPSDG